MHRRLVVLILMGAALAALPVTVTALGLDLEAKGGVGVALGSTDNSSVTGAARMAAGGGIGIDLYLLNVGPANLGIAAGVEYSYLTFHSTWTNFPFPTVDQTTDSAYSYVNAPVSIVASLPVGPVGLVFRAGGFVGYFLTGTADNTYSNTVPSNSTALDSSNTIVWEYGLHFTAGTDVGLGGNLSISPALQFDMGLTDTSVNGGPAGNFKDTFWSLAVVVGIKYKAI